MPVARYSASEIAWHQPIVTACRVATVAAILPIFPAGMYTRAIGGPPLLSRLWVGASGLLVSCGHSSINKCGVACNRVITTSPYNRRDQPFTGAGKALEHPPRWKHSLTKLYRKWVGAPGLRVTRAKIVELLANIFLVDGSPQPR